MAGRVPLEMNCVELRRRDCDSRTKRTEERSSVASSGCVCVYEYDDDYEYTYRCYKH